MLEKQVYPMMNGKDCLTRISKISMISYPKPRIPVPKRHLINRPSPPQTSALNDTEAPSAQEALSVQEPPELVPDSDDDLDFLAELLEIPSNEDGSAEIHDSAIESNGQDSA